MKSKPLLLALFAFATSATLSAQSNAPVPPDGFAAPAAVMPEAPARGGTAKPPVKEPAGFYFPGGTPRQFLLAVDKYYAVDWLSVADIPGDMAAMRIPSFRIRPEPPRLAADGRIGGGPDGAAGDPLESVVRLYNLLGEDKPEMGQLAIKGSFARPVAVTFKTSFLPSPQAVPPGLKAYPLKGIPERDWEKLANLAEEEAQKLMAAQRKLTATPGRPRSQDAWDMRQITVHQDTAVMTVIGPELMLQAVDSILTAWRANQQTGASQ